MKKPWIGVLDCNNFFVSCERLFRPDLRKKPVVVLSSNDGCVVARSQEIKDMGIPMGVPYFKIKDILKKAGATTFSSHFALYRDISRRVFQVMREELDSVEQYSIDEAFFKIAEDPELVAKRLKSQVERLVGIPVSIGIAKTKTQAKHANHIAKKGTGVCVLNGVRWTELTPTITLREIWGVGGALEMHFKRRGLLTVADLVAVPNDRILQIFGQNGAHLHQELRGICACPLSQTASPQQSIMSSRSFRQSSADLEVLSDALAYHVRHAAEDLRAMSMKTSQLRVLIRPSRHGDYFLRGGSFEAVLPVPTNDTIELLRVATAALKQLFEAGVPYQKVGVLLSRFTPVGQAQAMLFGESSGARNDTLMQVIDSLNQRGKREVVLLGSCLQTERWQARRESCSPAYTTQWKQIACIKA